MNLVRDVVVAALLLGGVFFNVVAAVGLVRLPDAYMRMHATSKTTTLGLAGVLLAVLVHFGSYDVSTKVLLVIVFYFLTAPVGAHMIARSAYICGVDWCPATTRYDLERATIVCATRGGAESARVHQQAIELARERRGELIFLHVVDTTALRDLAHDRAQVLLSEMRALAAAILSTAAVQAEAAGVHARTELREGQVAEALRTYLQEVDTDVLVVGYPHTAPGREHAAEDRLWELLDALHEEGKVRLVVAR